MFFDFSSKPKQGYVSCLVFNMLAEIDTGYLSHSDYLPVDHEHGSLNLITCPVNKTPSFNDAVFRTLLSSSSGGH